MKRRLVYLFIILFFTVNYIYGQKEQREKEKSKDGWSFGFFPAIGFDSNTGTKIGGIFRLYDYGDGSHYPRYDQNYHLELSMTTRGQAMRQLTYDTRILIPGIRMMAEASYITDKVFSFYGVNGYNAYYSSDYTSSSSPFYLSPLYYSNERALIKGKLEFIGKIRGNNLMWVGGFEYLNTRLDTVDLNNLNKGRDPDDYLPSVGGGLYGDFIRWGLIPEDQVHGGQSGILKIGAKYDSRDNESNPMKGLWTEMQFFISPGFISNGYDYARLAITHRQYFTIIPKTVNFVYRLSWQGKILGEMPIYMLPLVYNSAPQITLSGLGGAKTLRGILRNRVAGEDFVYGNAEIRWKLFRTVILNQNFYVSLAGFVDGGMVTGKYKLPEISDPEGLEYLSKGEKENLHISYGAGAHFVLNDNFVVTTDFGWAADPRDGSRGTYVIMGYLF